MRNELNISVLSDLMVSLDDYLSLYSRITQLDPKQRQSLEEYWYKAMGDPKNPNDKDAYNKHYKRVQEEYYNWKNPNVYLFNQSWSNTSGMYEGIGGQAFISEYTIVFENTLGCSCVYYKGKLMYIVEYNNEYIKWREGGVFPGLSSLGLSKMKVIYVNKR